MARAEELSFTVRSWSVEKGMPDNFVNQVVQDQRGFLWVGTAAGLARFDSVNFREFRDAHTSLEYGCNIRDMALSPDGSLLTLPASGGVVEWKAGEASVHPITASLAGLTLLDIFVEPGGAIWVGAVPTTLVRWEKGMARRFGPTEGINRRVNRASFAVDGRGRTWVAVGEFLGWYNNGKLVPLSQPMAEIGTAPVIARARSGGLWVASADRLLRLENDHATPVCEAPQWPGQRVGIQCLFEDSSGRLWIGSRRGGLFLYAGGVLKNIELASRLISSVTEDAEGNIWVATAGEGLCRLRPRTFTLLNSTTGLAVDTSSSVCADSTGAIWCANRNGGLVRYRNGAVQRIGAAAGGQDFTSRVAPDKDDNIWVGAGAGLCRLEAGKTDGLEVVQPQMRSVHILHGSLGGDMWVGSNLGLGYFHGGRYRSVAEAGGRSERFDALAENSQGKIWLATSESHEAVQQVRLHEVIDDRLCEQVRAEDWKFGPIHTLFFDHNDALWIGSAGGLILKRGDRLTRFSKAQGLPDDFIIQIQEDLSGYLWMAGRRGLLRAKIDDLIALADGKGSRVAVALFGADDGLDDAVAPGTGQPRAWRSPDGRLWFTLYKGIVGVDPTAVVAPRAPPPLYIEEVTLDQRTVIGPEQRLEIPTGVQRVRIRFAVLDYSHPEHVLLRYKLEGFDQDWIDADEDRTALYFHLPPGDYRLVVVAANQSGVWAEQETSLPIRVASAWWQTRWFVSGGILLAAAAIAWAARIWTVRKMRERLLSLEKEHALDRERARIARNLHDELGGSLTQIGLLAERLKRHRNMEEIEKTLGSLVRRTQGLATDLESIVWTVSPQNDSWDRLASFIARFARQFFDGTGIECRIEGVEAIPAQPLALDVQHEVLAVCKEALNNVLKHSKAAAVCLRLATVDNVFELTIQDNGAGFDPSLKEHAERNGLNNMRARAAELNASIVIESRPGAGATIMLRVSLSGKASSVLRKTS